MTPIGRLLYGLSDDGTSFDAMAKRAHDRGHKITASRLQQIAAGNNGKRMTHNAIRAVAAAVDMRPLAIATLEDEGFYNPAPGAREVG